MNEQIVFSDSECKRTGFLANSGFYSFQLDNKLWPTVEHYTTAKRFEGTKYEEIIRLAPTIYQVRRLAKAKTTAKGERVFGRGCCHKEAIYEKPDWVKSEAMFLESALKAKFQQNPVIKQKLLDTAGFNLVDSNSSINGPILEKVRKYFDKSPSKKRKQMICDMTDGRLTPYHKTIINGIIKSSKRLALVEGCNEFIDDMFEDLFFNIVPSKSNDLCEYISQVIQIDFTKLYTDFPNYISVYQQLKKTYRKCKHIRKFSIILLWICQGHEKDYHFPTSRSQISLLPKKRWYRKHNIN